MSPQLLAGAHATAPLVPLFLAAMGGVAVAWWRGLI